MMIFVKIKGNQIQFILESSEKLSLTKLFFWSIRPFSLVVEHLLRIILSSQQKAVGSIPTVGKIFDFFFLGQWLSFFFFLSTLTFHAFQKTSLQPRNALPLAKWIFQQKEKSFGKGEFFTISMVFIAVDCLTEALERTRNASIQIFHYGRQHDWRGLYLLIFGLLYTPPSDMHYQLEQLCNLQY